MPLNNSNKLIGMDENGKTITRKETEDLNATRQASYHQYEKILTPPI